MWKMSLNVNAYSFGLCLEVRSEVFDLYERFSFHDSVFRFCVSFEVICLIVRLYPLLVPVQVPFDFVLLFGIKFARFQNPEGRLVLKLKFTVRDDKLFAILLTSNFAASSLPV